MIIYHQNNRAAFAGNHRWMWPGQPHFHSRVGSPGSATPSINLRITFGSTVLVATGALTPPSGASDVPFEIECMFVVRSIGAGTTVLMAAGRYDNGQSDGLLAPTTESSPAPDSEVNNDLKATIEFGVASASNSATAQIVKITKVDPN